MPSGTPMTIARVTAMPTRVMCCQVRCITCCQSRWEKAFRNSMTSPLLIQWVLAQEIGGNGRWAFMIDIDPRVELAHGFVVEQFGQRLELFGQFRVGVERGLTHHG